MSEWWTYRLSDFLLFSPRTYWRLFELYNLAIWPAQLAAVGFGLAIAVASPGAAPRRCARRAAALLAACWLWIAWAFHLQRYATINWAARHGSPRRSRSRRCCSAWRCRRRSPACARGAAPAPARVGLGLFGFARCSC